jgi:LPXTG-site transpeptidase (sortase) family protein
MKRFSASLLDQAGTRYVELRVRTKGSWGSDASTVTVRSRVRTEAAQFTPVALHLRADAMRSIPTGSVTAQLTPSLHEVTFAVSPSGEWSTSSFAVTRSRGDKRVVTHALLAGRAMTSTTVNRKVYVSVSTMVATLLLLFGSLAVSKSANDSPVLADHITSAPLQTTDSTINAPATSAPATTIPVTTKIARPAQKFSALPAKSEFPAMETTTEQELLAGIPNDGKTWIVIPRLHLRMQIVSGISDDRLALGVGWYRSSQQPGTKGNIGLAGHRTTYPAPFYFLDKMRIADSVILIVGNELHRYLVKANANDEPYDVVQPDNMSVLAYLGYDSVTLTTCTPIGTANQRLVVHAKLMKRSPFVRKD